MMKKIILLACSAMVLTAGCGNDAPSQTHTVKIDVGGAVVYAGDPLERLAGVTVTLTDLEGNTRTATTSASGLWTIENVLPGVYTETYEAVGYETAVGTFGLDASGPNDIRNTFVSRPDVGLEETRLRAVVSSPLAAELRDGDAPIDGFDGKTLVYRPAVDGDVVVTFSRRILDGDVFFFDPESGNAADGTRVDTATSTTFTISAAAIDAIDGGNGPATDQDPWTFARLVIDNVDAITPIHGALEGFDADMRLNVAP